MTTTTGSNRIHYRKKPQQDRSVQRVDAILKAAEALIGQHGVAGLRMTDIARTARVPIGSLYQYFPEKTAIVGALFEQATERVHGQLASVFDGVSSIADANDRICALIDWYFAEYRENPSLRQILIGTESDPELTRLNVADSKRVGDTIHAAIRHLLPPGGAIDMEARAFMFSHLTGNMVLLSLVTDQAMAKKLLEEWKLIIRASLFAVDT